MSRQLVLVFVLFLSLSATSVEAQYRGHYRNSSYHRHAAAVIQGQRLQMISMLQSQLVAANQVLSNAESNKAMSLSKASEAMSKLNQIRQEIETANSSVHNALHELKLIEADIMAEQSEQSEFTAATKAVSNANEEVDRVFHLLVQTPQEEKISTDESRFIELQRLSESQRMKIKSTPEYKTATNQLTSAEQHVADVRKKLFESSKEWKEAKRALDEARHDSREEMTKAKPATSAVAHQNQQAQQLRNVVENAKFIAAQCELRLRQLGVKPAVNYGKR